MPGSALACADEATAALILLLQRLPPEERSALLLGGLLSLDGTAMAGLMGRPVHDCQALAASACWHWRRGGQDPPATDLIPTLKGHTMSQRLNYMQQSPQLFKKYLEFSNLVKDGALDGAIHDLVNIRASQLNGCAFCLDMHIKQARIRGDSELRMHHVAIWRESTLFEPRERAALAWTEVLTELPAHGVPDEAYEAARAHFSEQELSELTFHVLVINGWNRLNVAFPTPPGTHDKAFGLDKARLG